MHIYMCIHTCACQRSTCAYIHVHTYMCLSEEYLCIYTCAYIHVPVRGVPVHIYMCIHTCACQRSTCAYIHVHTCENESVKQLKFNKEGLHTQAGRHTEIQFLGHVLDVEGSLPW